MSKWLKIISAIVICASLIVLIAVALGATGCGNMNMGFGSYTFNYVHVGTHDGKCVEIRSWYDYETGIEVELADGSHMFLSEGTYWMSDKKCPLCK